MRSRVLVVAAFIGALARGHDEFAAAERTRVEAAGNAIIQGVERYKHENGSYPRTLQDGIADSRDETFRLKRSDVVGKFVVVRAVDAFYNVATESISLK